MLYQTYGTDLKEYKLTNTHIRFHQWQHPLFLEAKFTDEDISKVRKYVKPGDCIIDIGAHCGWNSVLYGIACCPTGHVLSFEPNMHVFEILSKNIAVNCLENVVTTCPIAITEKDGKQTFYYIDHGLCNGGFERICGPIEYEVVGAPLHKFINDIILKRVDFIKIDTEGNELNIIRSSRDVIKQHTPYMMIELYKYLDGEQRVSLFNELRELDYSCCNFSKIDYDIDFIDLKKPMSQQDFLDLNDQHCDLFCVPG